MSRIHRRALLRGAGAALLVAPFLDLLEPTRASSELAGSARRIVFFFSPNGTVHAHWRPTGTGSSGSCVNL